MFFYFLLFLLMGPIGTNGGGDPPDRWKECGGNGDGIIRMEKKFKDLLICYQSKLADDLENLKGSGRFKWKDNQREKEKEIAQKCVGTDGTKGWHGLMLEKEIGGKALTFKASFGKNLSGKLDIEFGGIDGPDFVEINITDALIALSDSDLAEFGRALPLGAFLREFDGTALRIVAMELHRAIGTNDIEKCKTKPSVLTPRATTLNWTMALPSMGQILWTSTPQTSKKPNLFVPLATNVTHFDINCVHIEFPADIVQFSLNISIIPYDFACQKHEKVFDRSTLFSDFSSNRYSDACAKVPTSSNCNKTTELFVCYKSKNQTVTGSGEIAEICQKHLGNAQFAAGFRVQSCARREAEKQLIVLESTLDFSFTDQIYTVQRNFSFKKEEIKAAYEIQAIFFIDFGQDEAELSAIRAETGGEEISEDLDKKNRTIGTILSSILEEPINGSWAKVLHFIPPTDWNIEIFFQTSMPRFSRLITRKTDLKPYENNPNKTIVTRCDELGDDCEPVRELLRKSNEILRCCSPSNPAGPCICALPTADPSEFLAPKGEKLPNGDNPWGTNDNTGDPLEVGDILYTKEQAQKEYDYFKKACAKCPPFPNEVHQRQKKQAVPGLRKWTKFPIAIKFNKKEMRNNFEEKKDAIEQGMRLIMMGTCINFTTDLTHNPSEGIEIIDNDSGCGWSYLGHVFNWQRLSFSCIRYGFAAHELLHALGFHHEHQRDDAMKFLKLSPKERNNPNYEPEEDTDNFGFPYDFASIMHYGASINDGYYNVITHNRFYQRTIGQNEKPSFKDLAIVNYLYCNEYCKAIENKCQNGGYPNPMECTQCLCPEGYGGTNCELLERNMDCLDLAGNRRELEADWLIRVLSPNVTCAAGVASCSCKWRIKPKDGKKLRIKLQKLDESTLNCSDPCGTSRVEIKYRKDKRARGAWLCCANQIDQGNEIKNWIEADERGVDIVISAHILSSGPKQLFELTYETDGAKLVPSFDCLQGVNFNKERNPGIKLQCGTDAKTGEPIWCECPTCPPQYAADSTWGCEVIVLNGQYREVRGVDESHIFYFQCLRREGTPKGFWAYWRDKSEDPIRIDDFQCLNYVDAGIKTPPKNTVIDFPLSL